MTRIVVIGCGPKAVALAAKAQVLRELGWSVPELVIVDKIGPAANWDGSNGYTDGDTLLGTTPFEDVGFPYASLIDPAVDQAMLKFSYMAHLVDIGTYAEWVDRAQTPPTHSMLARYLQWVLSKLSDQRLIIGTVTSVTRTNEQWLVAYESSAAAEQIAAEAVVVTGAGDPFRFPRTHDASIGTERVFNGQDLWPNIERFRGLKGARIAVVGGGETAAGAVVGLLARIDDTTKIEIITPHPMLFTRNEHWMEVMYFSKVMSWTTLSRDARLEVIRHADRGTFSVAAKGLLDSAFNVDVRMGTVTALAIEQDAVRVTTVDPHTADAEYDYVVEATGFDPLSFAKLFPEDCLGDLDELCERIGYDLAFDGLVPRLHLPSLAAMAQGPGFPNLSCLGMLSERILMPYIDTKLRTEA